MHARTHNTHNTPPPLSINVIDQALVDITLL